MRGSNLAGAVIFCGVGLVLTAGRAEAQFPLNIAAGPTFSNISNDDYETSSKTGFFAAVGTTFPVGENLAIQPYLGYVQKGASFDFGSFQEDDTYSYLEIPVFLTYGVPLSSSATLGLSAGPQIGFMVDCKEAYDDGTEDFDCSEYDDFEGTEFGLIGSVGVSFPVGGSTLAVGGGYDYGLTDVYSEVEGGFKNRVFFLFVDYGFSLGGGT